MTQSARRRPRILLAHTPDMRANYFGARALAGLRKLGDVVLHERAEPLDAAGVIAAAKGCDLVVADRNTPVPAAVLVDIPDAAAVLRVAVDIRNIDVSAASAAGILVCQASRTWVPAVSELVIGLMIDIARGISRADSAYKAGRTQDIRMGVQLSRATAGIIGYGPLARNVAHLCLALGMSVVVHDPYVTVDDPAIRQASLEETAAAADFLIPLAVATEETECIVDTALLARMKPTAFLVNLSRGNLIDEAALARALDEKRIAGAALDVGRAPDQMPSPHLARRSDVVATPHIGGLTPDGVEGQALEVVDQIAALVAGRIPSGAVNAAAARRLARFGIA